LIILAISTMNNWISQLFENPDMLRMGHCQSRDDLNLGMGWLYYGFTRLLHPRKIVVIGSWRGFTPLVFGKALIDNGENGIVHFIDPSLADDFWKDADRVNQHFKNHGIENIQHHLMTSQEFVESDTYKLLDDIGIVFIDGLHTREQAKFDYEAFKDKLSDKGIMLFHDSVIMKWSRNIYGKDREYQTDVKLFIDELRTNNTTQLLDLPFAQGLTIVRPL
jgi:predicted O-methyltransferase YrrM